MINIPDPELQIEFSKLLIDIRKKYLQEALSLTIGKIGSLHRIDQELTKYAPEKQLLYLAQKGLRGELVFAVPCLIEANPYLLGYYRLLLGFSQKEFYTHKFGLVGFARLESKGILPDNLKILIPELCKALVASASKLVASIHSESCDQNFFDDLTLLTVGPQLRGGSNVRKGIDANSIVFNTIYDIVKESSAPLIVKNKIEILNAANRKVFIEFSADPDIVIREEMREGSFRNIVAIEVKGGKDFANIHNRIGEAEKSHQKAKANGYVECWTVVNVSAIDFSMARKESPSTNTFYQISSLTDIGSNEYHDFKARIISLTGIIGVQTHS